MQDEEILLEQHSNWVRKTLAKHQNLSRVLKGKHAFIHTSRYLFIQRPEQTISPSHQCELEERKKEKGKTSILFVYFSKTEIIGKSLNSRLYLSVFLNNNLVKIFIMMKSESPPLQLTTSRDIKVQVVLARVLVVKIKRKFGFQENICINFNSSSGNFPGPNLIFDP